MHVCSRCLLNLGGQLLSSARLCSVCAARRRKKKNYTPHIAPEEPLSGRKYMCPSALFTCAKQLFMNELKLKMAVDARRKWLPREKVMPGKPGGDDGDAHTLDQSESSPPVCAPPPLVQWSGTALPPMGVRWVRHGGRVQLAYCSVAAYWL